MKRNNQLGTLGFWFVVGVIVYLFYVLVEYFLILFKVNAVKITSGNPLIEMMYNNLGMSLIISIGSVMVFIVFLLWVLKKLQKYK